MLRDDCSSSTVSVFNNNPDHPEFYEQHQTNKTERVHNPGGSEYYEKANSQKGLGGGLNEYYEHASKKKEPQGSSEYYAPLRLPVNCSAPEVELRTTSHSVSLRL